MAVPVSMTAAGTFSVGVAKPLFTMVSYAAGGSSALTRFELLADGQFAILEPVNPTGGGAPSIQVVEILPALIRQTQG